MANTASLLFSSQPLATSTTNQLQRPTPPNETVTADPKENQTGLVKAEPSVAPTDREHLHTTTDRLPGHRKRGWAFIRGAVKHRALGRRFGVGAIDQAVSSLSNIMATISVARVSTPREFGGFALVYTAYIVFLGWTRGLTGEAFVVLGHGETAASDVFSAALFLGLAGATLFSLCSLFFSTVVGVPLLVIGVALPFLMVQDAGRLWAIGTGTPRLALVSDATWCAVFIAGYITELAVGIRGTTAVVATWAIAGIIAMVIVIVPRRPDLSIQSAVRWLRDTVRVGGWLGSEYLLIAGTRQINLTLISAWLGLDAVAGIRGGQAMLGPVTTLQYALLVVLSPEIVRSRGQVRRQRKLAVVATTLLVLTDVGYGGALWLLPSGAGHAVLGSVWQVTHRLLVPQVAIMICVGAILGGEALLRGNVEVRAALKIRVFSVVAGCGGVVVGCLSRNVLLALWLQAAAVGVVIVPFWVLGWTRAA